MKYIYLLFLFCLFGCTRTTNKQSNIKNIYLEQSNIQDFIGLPIQLTTLDSVLFINDFYGDSLIHCISLKDNKPIITLSQTYIKNYDELKNLISNKSKNLGKSNYGFLNEILDVIRLK